MESKLRTRRDFLKGSAVAVGAAVLTACAPAAQPAGDMAESGDEIAAAEEILIRFAMWDWYANTPGVRWDEWNQTEAFPIFEEANPGTKLEWEPLGSGWPDKILTQMAAGTAPDIISTWSPHIDTWAEKHQLLDLQPLIDANIPNADDIYIGFAWDQMWDPFNNIRMGMLSDLDITSIYYNKTAFEEEGLPLPTIDWTEDEYLIAAETLTIRDDNGDITRWGGQLRPGFWLSYSYHVETHGGEVRDEETRMLCGLGEPEAQEGLEWVRRNMWDTNVFAQNNQMTATGIPNMWTGLLPAEVVAMAERSADQFFALAESITEFEWDIAHIPSGPKDRACMGLPDEWVVYKGVVERGNHDEVWEMMKWLTGDWYQEKIATVSGRIPGLLAMADSWADTLRQTDPRLEQVRLETVVEQLQMGYPRRGPTFRFQQIAEELINPAVDQVFIEGKAPVSIFEDIGPQVTEAQQDALQRATG